MFLGNDYTKSWPRCALSPRPEAGSDAAQGDVDAIVAWVCALEPGTEFRAGAGDGEGGGDGEAVLESWEEIDASGSIDDGNDAVEAEGLNKALAFSRALYRCAPLDEFKLTEAAAGARGVTGPRSLPSLNSVTAAAVGQQALEWLSKEYGNGAAAADAAGAAGRAASGESSSARSSASVTTRHISAFERILLGARTVEANDAHAVVAATGSSTNRLRPRPHDQEVAWLYQCRVRSWLWELEPEVIPGGRAGGGGNW